MDEKVSGILKLNRQLRLPDELPGNFLPKDYPPKFGVMFLAEMPSMNTPKNWNGTDNFNFCVSARDRFFHEMLVKHGLGGSYCTDIVKRRVLVRKPQTEEIEEWKSFLLKEIEIINPKLILVVGKTNYTANYIPYLISDVAGSYQTDWIFHYSRRVSNEKFEKRFNEVVKKYQQLINS